MKYVQMAVKQFRKEFKDTVVFCSRNIVWLVGRMCDWLFYMYDYI